MRSLIFFSDSRSTMSSRKGVKLRNWSQEDMDKALTDVRERGISERQAARENNVPRKTLSDRLRNKLKGGDNCTMGKPPILTNEQEENLCSYIAYMAQRGFPLTVNQIIMFAWCIDRSCGKSAFGESGPCYGWWLHFKKRHPDAAKLRKADTLDRGRAVFSTVENLRHYFSLLKDVLDKNDLLSRPQDIYKCDESVVDLNKSTQKVVIPKRMRTSHSRQVSGTEHISIHCCISAGGAALPPMIIFKQSFPGGNYTANGPDGALYAKQESGFMDSELFLKWFQRIFIVHARPSAENPVLLLLDGHASHCSPQLIDCARENHVILLALAPHTTHLCLPLDVCVYKVLKMNIGKQVKLGQALKGDLWILKRNVPRILKEPFEKSMSLANIKSGFRKCGIFPFNPNAIDKEKLLRNKLIPDETVDLSLPAETEASTVASVPQQSDANQAMTASASLVVPDNQLGVTLNIDGLQTTVTPGPEDHPATVVIPSSAEDDHELSDIAVVSAVDDENPIAPVKIRVFTGSAKAPSNILEFRPRSRNNYLFNNC